MSRYRRYQRDELDRAAVYRALAEHAGPERREILLGLAAAEERHARYWASHLPGVAPDESRREHRPRLRARLLIALARRVGITPVLPLLERSERSEIRAYEGEDADQRRIALDERVHARVLAGLTPSWRVRTSQSLRAGVFGANDGLVSNLALVMGVAGAQVEANIILLTGLAGMLAGSISMAAGEFISVTAQRELLASEVRLEADHLEAMEGADHHDLELLGRALGMDDTDLARIRAEGAAADVDFRLRSGPEELSGSPVAAALSNGTVFVAGAAVPVAPFVFLEGNAAVLVAMTVAGVALFAVGALLSVVTGRPAWWSGLRQLLIGVAAATITYGIGSLLGDILI